MAVRDYAFEPASLTVEAGTTVTLGVERAGEVVDLPITTTAHEADGSAFLGVQVFEYAPANAKP